MKLINKTIPATLLTIFIFSIFIYARAVGYGDLRLSVATIDTESYITSARNPLLSWQGFSGRRLFTTNLLFKLSTKAECPAPVPSNPFHGQEREREILPCFQTIALTQNALSIFGWCLLAYLFSKRINNPFYKILSIITILGFGFTPQIAEWDSVLNVESITLSLGVISLALLIESAHRFPKILQGYSASHLDILTITLFLFVFLLWAFARDAHLYAIFTLLILIIPLFLFKPIRNMKWMVGITLLLIITFIFGSATSQASTRWHPSIEHSMNYYILPYPARVAFMMERGMPNPNDTSAYKQWFETKANKDYAVFLLSHPGFILTTYFELSSYLRSDFLQTFFPTPKLEHYTTLLKIGEALHPETNHTYILSILLFISISISAISTKNTTIISWAWLASWLFIYAAISLTLTFFGDVDGTRRHIYPSVELFRLFNWIFLFVHIDLASKKLNI